MLLLMLKYVLKCSDSSGYFFPVVIARIGSVYSCIESPLIVWKCVSLNAACANDDNQQLLLQ